MAQDKKVRDGRLAFVLARDIGEAFVARDVDLRDGPATCSPTRWRAPGRHETPLGHPTRRACQCQRFAPQRCLTVAESMQKAMPLDTR